MPFSSDRTSASSDKASLQTIIASIVVFATTFSVLIYMCLQVENKSKRAISANFRMLADERISRVQTRFRAELARISSTKRFIENSDVTTATEFTGFTAPFRQSYGNYIFFKFMDSSETARKSFPATAARSFNYQNYINLPRKHLLEPTHEDRLTVIFSSAPQSKYYAGFEFNSKDPLLLSLETARKTGTSLLSAPIEMPDGKYQAFFVSAIGCQTNNCDNKTAFVASIIPFSDLLEADLPASSVGQMAISLNFISKDGISTTVYENGIPPAKQEDLVQSKILATEGFQYKMTTSASDAFMLSQGDEFKSSYLIALSFIVSSLLSIMFFVLANQSRKTAYLVLKKTHELEVINRTDFLTGIYNRRHFNETMESLTNAIHPIFIKHGLVALDVDHFKSINDNFGHNKGDEVLSELVTLISNNLRTKDIFCRTGGEEFFIVCPDTSTAGCLVLAEKLRQAVESNEFPIRGRVTISLGVTEFSYGESVALITHKADQALYAAKTSGRNRVEVSA